MNISLLNHRILVTGASRGIGRGIAEQLSASGAEVLIHFNKNLEEAQSLQKNLPNPSHLTACDLSDLEAVKGWIPELIRTYGAIDAIVNNAGIAISVADDTATGEWTDAWLKTMDVNINALAIISKEFIEHARVRKQGRIINISSRAAFRGDTPDYLAYAASKAAIVSYTRSLARYYGKEGIKAFIIAPGFTRTDMAQDFMDQYGEAYALNDIALTELTEPKDIAPMVTLLCSGLADHATGATIDINAGSYVH
ncbi:NAD(P)-dependent dehydrogenase, short-chain alcohol dehydrogenase family [Belliella buryatensis]|uniref:NAD(P)-dependent dehydrogenase, short-chain alcohol dehydrogenase family n=1 Tax=Belliella buryatensis TaxID=1500549 RepID=A0A239BKU4_9BACT|nr:SDR family oxidoreductase [Belliella buryatensis]SNS07988.1 NAD(P)-dependent dehydrogenase, short-chain alcohol dehydrogenase family [Belliella buryatensis]